MKLPTDATRRHPGILGPYYPDATHGSKLEAPGKPSFAASMSYDYGSTATVLQPGRDRLIRSGQTHASKS